MAITKIMCMKSAEHGNVAAHLKHSLAYICNEAKTEKGRLVGGINCLPDFAYEQNRPYKYVEPPVYHPGYALRKKPSNAFQQRYYGKLYRMCVVQKCRFQYK